MVEGSPENAAGAEGGARQPSEEELRAHLEEQLRKVRVEDLLVESAASIVNLTVRRIAKPDEQDLEQARVGIEAVRALVDLVEGEVAGQIRSALSDLQVLYARASRGEPLEGPPGEGGEPTDEAGERPAQGSGPQSSQGEPPPKLWTPGR